MRPARILAAVSVCALVLCAVVVGFQLLIAPLRVDASLSGQALRSPEQNLNSTVGTNPAKNERLSSHESLVPHSDALNADSSLDFWSPRVDEPPTRFIIDELDSDSSISVDAALESSPTIPLMINEQGSSLDPPVLVRPRP